MLNDYFAAKLLTQLHDKSALAAIDEAIQISRQYGFDYADDEEALEHYFSESKEVAEAYRNEGADRTASEVGDLQLIIAALLYRKDRTSEEAAKQSVRKFLLRLKFVEDKMRSEGKTWKDVGTWKDDVKPNYWDKAKAAGL